MSCPLKGLAEWTKKRLQVGACGKTPEAISSKRTLRPEPLGRPDPNPPITRLASPGRG